MPEGYLCKAGNAAVYAPLSEGYAEYAAMSAEVENEITLLKQDVAQLKEEVNTLKLNLRGMSN